MSYGRTIRIPLDYETIQAGIDAAVSGDTVKVDAGAYNERIQMKEGINLIGSGAEYSSIYYFASSYTSFICMDSNCILKGFTITSGGKVPGIQIDENKKNIFISNNKIINCRNYGIYSNGISSNLTIINNTISSIINGSGGISLSTQNLTIKNNIIFDCNGTGLSYHNSNSPITVSNNLIYNCSEGICISNRVVAN